MLFGENGLIPEAQLAVEEYENSEKQERNSINRLSNMLSKNLNKHKEPDTEDPDKENPSVPSNPAKSLSDLIDKPASNTNQTVTDLYGNPITIPAGFTIVKNGENFVEYKYSGNGIPSVQDGIVIKDSDGNQFVWIPIGEIKNKEGAENPTTTITLGRYSFLSNSKGDLKQNSNVYTQKILIEDWYREISPAVLQNTVARNLKEFVENTQKNSGYYFARYEASKGENSKAQSKQATPWTNIKQPLAATYAQDMYGETDNFASDLVNSYAWDTALIFIQSYSEGNEAYSKKVLSHTKGETGDWSSENTDKVCNIYDMSSNYYEWETESDARDVSNSDTQAYKYRGGASGHGRYSGLRSSVATNGTFTSITFRCILYLR